MYFKAIFFYHTFNVYQIFFQFYIFVLASLAAESVDALIQ